MSMQAEVLGLGRFSCGVLPYLQYPAEYYEHTREGVSILERVFYIETGSTESRELAACFGIDAWDFNQHELDGTAVDIERLTELVGPDEVARFVGLRSAGFRFFFLPNG